MKQEEVYDIESPKGSSHHVHFEVVGTEEDDIELALGGDGGNTEPTMMDWAEVSP